MAHSTDKADQLFRRKLEQMEVTPKASSWDTVKGHLQVKQTSYFPIWKVAASVVILVSLGYLIFTLTKRPAQSMLSENDPPAVNPAKPAIELPENTKRAEKPLEKARQIRPSAPLNEQNNEGVKETESQPDFQPEEGSKVSVFTLVAVERIGTPTLEVMVPVEFPELIQSLGHTESFPKVKITYIASSNPEPIFPISEKLSKVITKAQQISPGELLADIRDAKDQLLSRN